MIRRLLAGYLAVTSFVLVVLGIPLAALYARHERSRLVGSVRLDAAETATFTAVPLSRRDVSQLERVVDRYGDSTRGRMVVLDRAGVSVADSHDDPGRSFAGRPEVDSALRGALSYGFRRSESLGRELFYVAAPVNSGGDVLGAVRITYPASYVESRIRRSWAVLGAVAAGVVALVAGVSAVFARAVSRPVRALEHAAARLGEGDLRSRVDDESGPPEVRSLGRSFNDTAAKLERLMDAQQTFVADASHQLRTPLAAMRLRLENLQATSEGSIHEQVGATLEELHRLSRIVDGLLTLARADSAPASPVEIDVDRIVTERIASWSAFAAEHGVAFAVGGTAGSAFITPDSLEQALDNLVANAIEATPAGGRVSLVLASESLYAHVHVVDEGPGMTREQRERAFTRFATSGNGSTAGVGGVGLGLAIAQRLALRDRGDLTLERAPDGGLDAHLRLPASRAPERGGLGERARPGPVPPSPGDRGSAGPARSPS
jgi:signal transduction histidine kinase